MTIVYRTSGAWGAGKGSDLTPVEADTDLWTLASAIAALEATIADGGGAGIAYFSVGGGGTEFFVTLTDHTVLGPRLSELRI